MAKKEEAVGLMEKNLEQAVTKMIQAKAILKLHYGANTEGMMEFATGIATKYQMDETEAKRMLGVK